MSYDLFSDSAKDTALDAVGGTIMGSVETELLKQVFVAVGNGGGGGGGNPFDQDLNTTDGVQFEIVHVESAVNGEMLRIEGTSAGGEDVGFAVYNNTGDNANSFFFNQSSNYVGIGIGANYGYIQSNLSVSFTPPTSPTGLPVGSLWNNDGSLEIVT